MRRSPSWLASSLVLCLALLALAGPARAAEFDPRSAASMQDTLNRAVDYYGVPGAVVGVRAPDGRTWFGASGVAEIKPETIVAMGQVGALGSDAPRSAQAQAQDRPQDRLQFHGPDISPGLKFRIASITKTFTATAVLLLAQDNLLSLDDSVDKWLPGLVPNGTRITVRQLLNHTSGLYNYTDYTFYKKVCQVPGKTWTPEELVALSKSHAPYFEPGKGWKYSNTNYILLGMIVEKSTGREFSDVVAGRILQPLGLANTLVPKDDGMSGDCAHGYIYGRDGWIDFTHVSPSTGGPAASMVSTADLLAWAEALDSGTLLNDRYRKEMFTFVSTGVKGFSYGLGVMNWNGAVGHNGVFFDAYTSCVYTYKGYRFVVLANGNAKPGTGTDNAAQSIFWSVAKTLPAATATTQAAPANG
jgi:D-alanyl-D-alanine carboxypeptidase